MEDRLCNSQGAGVTWRCNGAVHPLAHTQDIILTASSPPPPLSNLERVVEVGEIFSLSRDHHIPEMPHSSPPPSEHVPNEMPQPSPAYTKQVYDETP